MANDWTTTIQAVAIRLAGEIETNIDLTHAGTPGAEAHVFVGSVLVRVKGRRTAQRLSAIWREAALHTNRLPVLARRSRTNPNAECPAGLVVRIGSDAALGQQLNPPSILPVHIRVQVGPLAWLVMDQAAYVSTRHLWERVERLL